MIELDSEIASQREERELDMLAKRCLELGALFLHEVLQIMRLLDSLLDAPGLIIQFLGLSLLIALLLLLQLGTHLGHPLLLHHLHTQIVALGLLGLLLKEHTAPQEDAQGNNTQEDDHNPTVAKQWRSDGDIEHCLILTDGSILIEHADMEHIVAMMQRHIGDVRVVGLGGYPLIAEALELVDKA